MPTSCTCHKHEVALAIYSNEKNDCNQKVVTLKMMLTILPTTLVLLYPKETQCSCRQKRCRLIAGGGGDS